MTTSLQDNFENLRVKELAGTTLMASRLMKNLALYRNVHGPIADKIVSGHLFKCRRCAMFL